jgi:hypothetical protein
MYCHDLRASFGGTTYTIPCEDSPSSDGLVAIWPYELKMDPIIYSNLIKALHQWASNEGLSYRIYVTRDRFESDLVATNKPAEQAVDGNPH